MTYDKNTQLPTGAGGPEAPAGKTSPIGTSPVGSSSGGTDPLNDVASFTPQDISPEANSRGGSGFGFVPDLSSRPDLAADLNDFLGSHTYSFPNESWLRNEDAQNANSSYIKFGGSDANSNNEARRIFGNIGAMPTRPVVTQALQNLYNTNPSLAANQTQGPSYNSIIGGFLNAPGGVPGPGYSNPVFEGMFGGGPGGFGRGMWPGPFSINDHTPYHGI